MTPDRIAELEYLCKSSEGEATFASSAMLEALDEIKRLRAELEWYGWLYDMPSFTTAPNIYEVSDVPPAGVEVQGNPIAHDRGQRARKALAGGGDGNG